MRIRDEPESLIRINGDRYLFSEDGGKTPISRKDRR